MRVTHVDGRLVVLDRPGLQWLFGITFVCSGTAVLLTPFFSYGWETTFGWRERMAVLAIGLAHLAAGLWMLRSHPSTRTELDRAAGIGSHRVRRPGSRGSAVTQFTLAEVCAVDVLQDKNADGDAVYLVRLWLSDSRVLPLQAHATGGERRAHERAAAVRDYLGVVTPGRALMRLR